MQYFQAVQEGKKRANEAQMKLFDVAGFSGGSGRQKTSK